MSNHPITVLILCILELVACQYMPTSPCPNVFTYENDGYQWYGAVMAPDPPPYGSRITLKVTMTLDTILPSNYVGKIELDEQQYTVLQKIRTHQPIRYRILFPLISPLPEIIKIVFDRKTICSGQSGRATTTVNLDHVLKTGNSINDNYYEMDAEEPSVPVPLRVTEVPKPRLPIPPSTTTTTTSRPPDTRIVPQNTNQNMQCGTRVTTVTPLIFNGDEVSRGEWPWLVAIFKKKTAVEKSSDVCISFQCAGTLISETRVLSAAHCMFQANGQKTSVENILLKFGPYNLHDLIEDSTQMSGVQSFKTHDDFEKVTLLNDIALIVTSTTILFNNFIRPACLWDGRDDQSMLTDLKGTVVGWGQEEDRSLLTSAPRSVTVPIVAMETCRGTNQFFFSNTSNKTICAGSRDGRGPCRGDSGGGLYVKQGRRWVVRGIVSNSLPHAELDCDLKEYVVYTDVAKFSSWINEST